MALSFAEATFQCPASPGAQLCAFNSWFRHRASGNAADPNCGCDVGATAAYRPVKLDPGARMGRSDRHFSDDGLRLLVVALG